MDVLYRLDAINYSIRKHQIIAQQGRWERWGPPWVTHADPEVEDVISGLKSGRGKYADTLFSILGEESTNALTGEGLIRPEEEMRQRLASLFQPFEQVVVLLQERVGKIAATLGVSDRVRAEIQSTVMSGCGSLHLEAVVDESTPSTWTSRLPQGELRFRRALEEDIEVTRPHKATKFQGFISD